MAGYDEMFSVEDGLLVVRLGGEFPMEMLSKEENLFEPLIAACAAHECKRALVDARGLAIKLDTLGLLRAAEDAAKLPGLNIRVALVARTEMVDPFFETAAFNRGGLVRVFLDPDEAKSWLSEQ